MPDLTPQYLSNLTDYHLPGLESCMGIIHPAYGGQSIANLPASICEFLEIPPVKSCPLGTEFMKSLGDPCRQIILLVVDGLGLKFFQQFLRQEPWSKWLQTANLFPLTSVVPSTTSTALTSLWTGVTPIQHGILGYEIWLKEFGMVANMIFQSPSAFNGNTGSLQLAGFKPETFLPVPVLGNQFKKYDLDIIAFQHNSIARSGLSKMLLQDVDVYGYRTVNDLWVSLRGWMNLHQDDKSYAYAYWGDIDELSHRYGPDDERVVLEFKSFSSLLDGFLNQICEQGRGDGLFLMTADHGLIRTPRLEKYNLKHHPELMKSLIMQPTGENRLSYLYIHPGREELVRKYIEKEFPGEFCMMKSRELITLGLFGNGPVYTRSLDRLGDWVILPNYDAYLWWAERENPLLGRHGGLSSNEMLVPLFALRY